MRGRKHMHKRDRTEKKSKKKEGGRETFWVCGEIWWGEGGGIRTELTFLHAAAALPLFTINPITIYTNIPGSPAYKNWIPSVLGIKNVEKFRQWLQSGRQSHLCGWFFFKYSVLRAVAGHLSVYTIAWDQRNQSKQIKLTRTRRSRINLESSREHNRGFGILTEPYLT